MANIIRESGNAKWLKIKDHLKEGLTPKRARHLDIILENTRKDFIARQKLLMENASAGAVSAGNIASLNKVILPILRRVLPNVIANEIVGVQPMQGPTAQIMSLRYIYGTTSAGAGVTAGDEAQIDSPEHLDQPRSRWLRHVADRGLRQLGVVGRVEEQRLVQE